LQQAQYWFGGFSREQEAAIRGLSDARPLNNELLMAERMHRQQALIDLLKKYRRKNRVRKPPLPC